MEVDRIIPGMQPDSHKSVNIQDFLRGSVDMTGPAAVIRNGKESVAILFTVNI